MGKCSNLVHFSRSYEQKTKNIYIYKIKVLSVHWSKSRHILVALVSNKVMNENTLIKIPVCLSVCFRGFREKLLTIHLKTAAGIIMKFHIWIRCLLTYVFSYITFWYLDPKMGFGGAHKWKLSNNSETINSTADCLMSKVVGVVISYKFCLEKFPQNTTQRGGGVKKCKFLPLEQTQPNFVYIICGPIEKYKCKN